MMEEAVRALRILNAVSNHRGRLTCYCAVWYERWGAGPSRPSPSLSAMSGSSLDRPTSPWTLSRDTQTHPQHFLPRRRCCPYMVRSLTCAPWRPRCAWARCRSSRSPRRRPRPARGWSSCALCSWAGNSGFSLAASPADTSDTCALEIWNV